MPTLRLAYGNRQRFRFRCADINLLGSTGRAAPPTRSEYVLNDGPPVPFWVEPPPESGPPRHPYGSQTAAVNRLRGRIGDFNIEIPVASPTLRPGSNRIRIAVDGPGAPAEVLEAEFDWDPAPLALPWTLPDLRACDDVQSVAQVVDGGFDLDREANAIVARAPVANDSLLLLGSPHACQEATYEVRFAAAGGTWCFLGLSDFFAGHEAQRGVAGIKPGHSTAGLATLDQRGRARLWLAWGDGLADDARVWVAKTERPARLEVRAGVAYCVRHQCVLTDEVTGSRFRIWRKDEAEPDEWLCEENDLHVDRRLPRPRRASFGLFQSLGAPTAWSQIGLRRLDPDREGLHFRRRSRLRVAWWQARAAAAGAARRLVGGGR